jgi:nucleotide-binding universal stress UspA family protein
MFKHILIPTDGSKLARKAIKAGVALAGEIGAKVTAYHALEMVPAYVFGDGYVVDATAITLLEQHARKQGEKYLAEAKKAAVAAGVRCDTLLDKPEVTHQGIIRAARRKKCDAIFIASHGRGGVKALLLGSVTQRVLAHSQIPVVVYR